MIEQRTVSATAKGSGAHLWRNASVATLQKNQPDLGIIDSAAIAAENGHVTYVGPEVDLPTKFQTWESTDCERRWITPGLIDCHTHLVHAGNRAHEFEMRLSGASYEDIARAGGGIISSIKAVRDASIEQLVTQALPRLDALIAEGVTTVEIKSGYGLSVDAELKMLRAARTLGIERNIAIKTTYLGAHATPADYRGRNEAFITDVVIPGLIAGAKEGLIDAVDGFCEGIAFSPDEMRTVFDAARCLDLPVKLHADQLSNLHGAKLASEYGALSADHLEYTDEAGCIAMAASNTVAVLLPGAYYFIRETKRPPIDLFRRHGVSIALATDNNPGTSPLTSLLLTMNMAATLFNLTVEECLAGVTREAAKALNLTKEVGTIEVGKRADLAIWNIERPAELVYRMGFNPLHQRVFNGVADK
jgi:imidazolonepropionase